METTAIIISFNRPQYTIDCINSLHRNYPKIKILVGENGIPNKNIKKTTEDAGGQYIVFPFDSGVPYIRNRLFEKVKTKYVLIGDDDFYYTKEARIEEMEKFLKGSRFAIIGGRVKNENGIYDWQGYLKIKKGLIFERVSADEFEYKVCVKSGLRYARVDMMTNFWLGKIKKLPPYKEDQKIYHEHTEYMIYLKGKVKMAFSPEVVVWHKKQKYSYKVYGKYRWRKEEEDRLRKINMITVKWGEIKL